MKIASKHSFLLLVALFVILTLFVQMSESERASRRNGRRRNPNRRRGGTRASRRERNRQRANRRRNSTTTTTVTTTASPGDGCEEIQLPMCKGLLSYTHTKLPNRFNHTTQLEVYQELEHLWVYMDHTCSRNVRVLTCALYLPKCGRNGRSEEPCRRTCMIAKRKCAAPFLEMFGLVWASQFRCRGLGRQHCVAHVPEPRCENQYPTCVNNSVFPVCSGVSFSHGTLPNMFHQCHVQQINTELDFYSSLRQTNCHASLDFLLCGVYSPFCIRAEIPFTFPCREICEEVRTACEPHYRRLNNGLPWPNKLQCHRYPATDMPGGHRCVMPNEGTTFITTK